VNVVLEIALFKGRWGCRPCPSRVRRQLQQLFGDALLGVTFHDAGDEAIVVQVNVDCEEYEGEAGDDAFRAFLGWKPQYESMIEVSVV